jgi:hypothetical protein
MDLTDVSEAAIIDEALKNLYDGVTEHELSTVAGHHGTHHDRAGT